MEEDGSTLADLFRAWTAWTGWAFSLTVIGLSVFGLALSLMSFIRMYRHVQESNGAPGGSGIPFGQIFAVLIAGLICVSGLVYGFSSLLWNPVANP